jgi:hypothetical protein
MIITVIMSGSDSIVDCAGYVKIERRTLSNNKVVANYSYTELLLFSFSARHIITFQSRHGNGFIVALGGRGDNFVAERPSPSSR